MNKDPFVYIKPKKTSIKVHKIYDLTTIYENAHSELTLQQSKRDQIIVFYLTLVSFLLPFTYSLSNLDNKMRIAVFIGLFIIGAILAVIIIRYKVYKEVYWACCQTLSQLANFEENQIDKNIIQGVFYEVLKKKNPIKSGYINGITKNFFSAETLIYEIHILISSAILVLITYLLSNSVYLSIIIPVIYSLLMHYLFFKAFFQVFKVCKTNSNKDFNFAFSKAWFLHFYLCIDLEE